VPEERVTDLHRLRFFTLSVGNYQLLDTYMPDACLRHLVRTLPELYTILLPSPLVAVPIFDTFPISLLCLFQEVQCESTSITTNNCFVSHALTTPSISQNQGG
jgi:hypothetical protein